MNIDILGKYFFSLYYNKTVPFEINKIDPKLFYNYYDILEGKITPESIFSINLFDFEENERLDKREFNIEHYIHVDARR